ncbi:zinc transporter ZntB [Desulfoluna butyratoxydans]|uniref:Mg2+ transporter protein cora-like/zinc transport protein zntb n=1 Tax=Desulfoluna butyratoxydans TaxID=231438 RepID=A0A4U8YHM4_9BACT|nr:zinc transporter ZntB [Desulfoluna butyratoxydans]VFQ42727.1 mg2+ transporter protein cora-like/zinc transport protein zntb [Desulfoluna butyratoxydans]
MEETGLITAFLLNGNGGGRRIGWEEIQRWSPDQGALWIHLDYSDPGGRKWLTEQSGVSSIVTEALLSDETRPRFSPVPQGALLALRGVNLNPDCAPEDMVAIRILAAENRVITTLQRPLRSITDIASQLEQAEGPRNTGDFLVELIDRITLHMEDTVADTEELVARIEEEVVTTAKHELRSALSEARRSAIILRRYLTPQREAMQRLAVAPIPWFTDSHRLHLREATDRLIRHVEDLEAARDRAAITQEELSSLHSEQMSRRMYVLSLVAAVFLPLGFLTGLLGVNIGGIPGARSEWGFLLFTLILGVIICFQLLFFKRQKWF